MKQRHRNALGIFAIWLVASVFLVGTGNWVAGLWGLSTVVIFLLTLMVSRGDV